MKNDNPAQISLANFFIYNTEFGHKEGKEAEKIFYYYPSDEKIEKQCRLCGFCAGIVQFTKTFKPSKPCEFVHTEKIRMIFHEIDENFWIVMGLNVPFSDKAYHDDHISNPIYMSVLKQSYNLYKLFHGTLKQSLNDIGQMKLKENLKLYFDDYIETKLNIQDSDIMNTFNGIHFMSLDRCMYLKIQCLLNFMEEKIPLVNKTVVMHNDQVIWSGLEQEDIASIYTHLKELVCSNLSNPLAHSQPDNAAKFLASSKTKKTPLDTAASFRENFPTATTSDSNPVNYNETEAAYYVFDKVFLGKSLEQYYLIPYNLSKLTFFIFIRVNETFKLSLLKQIDEILGSNMVGILDEIADLNQKRNLINTDEKEIKYIYFNRLNLAQKSTLLGNSKETPKYILNLISQLSKDLEACQPTGEIFVKSGKDYWIACKKSDLREVYVIVCQKNANLTSIDDEVKQLCSTNFSNIFFME
jgi:hypothetical protein